MKRSLKTRLVIYLVAMALIPLIIMGAIVTSMSRTSLTAEVEEKVNIVVDNLLGSIDLFLDQNTNLIMFLSMTRAVSSMDKNQITPFLYDMTVQNPQILRFHVADVEGNVFSVPYSAFPKDYNVKDEEWYSGALEHKGSYISDVNIDELSTNTIVSISNVIYSNTGELAGVICADVSLLSLSKIVMNMKLGEEGFAFITDKKGNAIAHKDFTEVRSHQNYMDFDFVQNALEGNVGFTEYTDKDGHRQYVAYGQQKHTGWGVFVQQPVSEIFASLNNIVKTIVLTTVIMAAISIALGLFIGHIVVKPIRRLVQLTESVAKSDLTETVNIIDSTEIGDLASSFGVMTSHLKNLVTEVFTAAEDLSASAEELAAGAQQSSASAQEVSRAIEQIAAGASDQAQKLDEMHEVMDNLVSSNSIAEEGAVSTSKSAEQMTKKAQQSQKKMGTSTKKMDSIKASVDNSNKIMEKLDAKLLEIGKITSIIRDIVDQTNLLALNASIEAARAGEYGRSFAVVANEVRKLAEESGEAAKNIADIVKLIQNSSKDAVAAMAKSSQEVEEGQNLISEINQDIESLMMDIVLVADRSKRISNELTAQKAHVDSIDDMIHNISTISQETAAGTQEVSASSEEQTATMENISHSAQELANLADGLNQLVSKFKI